MKSQSIVGITIVHDFLAFIPKLYNYGMSNRDDNFVIPRLK